MHLVAFLLFAASASPPGSPRPDTVVVGGTLIAQFADARALAIDPGGTLYVADAGQDVVQILAPDGAALGKIGGVGTDHGLFHEPTDVDPTNGLMVVVADRRNGRLQRFTRANLHTETLPVHRADAFLGPASNGPGDGLPLAVAISHSNEIFVIESESRVVLKWDALRRPVLVVGGFGSAGGTLKDPVALAVNGNHVFVADADAKAIMVYDHFGGFVRSIERGQLAEPRALSVDSSYLWVVHPKLIIAYPLGDAERYDVNVHVGEGLVDAQFADGKLFLLTSTRLLVVDDLKMMQ